MASELETQIENRRRKRDALVALASNPYPNTLPYDCEPSEVQARHGESTAEALEELALELGVPGRVRSIREHGKTAFIDLFDGRAKLQLLVRKSALDEISLAVLENLDLGDYLCAYGQLMRTRRGELSLAPSRLTLASKALRPLPEKWHGLADVEARYRQRYLDLMSNPESRTVFEVRAAIVSGLRRALEAEGFLEVETPMMHPIAGGAAARPFATHHNTLDLELYLRIAPELYLKRLLVGGLHRVYEINRNFRNEGISTRHNPEFTMLEFYWAYSDYEKLMDFTENMIRELAVEVLGSDELPWKEGTLDLGKPWKRLSMRGAIVEHGGVAPERLDHLADLVGVFKELGTSWPKGSAGHPVLECSSRQEYEDKYPDLALPEGWYGKFLMELFEATAEEALMEPTFITEYPVEISPFAKVSPTHPGFTDRFELYMGGMEIANAFSELNDPEVQAERFRAQLQAREAGDDEAQNFDADYVLALEHGMPPAGGEGVGIDRLVMLFTNRQSIRDVILFPLLRPTATGGESTVAASSSVIADAAADSRSAPGEAGDE